VLNDFGVDQIPARAIERDGAGLLECDSSVAIIVRVRNRTNDQKSQLERDNDAGESCEERARTSHANLLRGAKGLRWGTHTV